MPIYTTYLAFLGKADYNPLNVFPGALQETLIYYVMRNRGNNEVAPISITLMTLTVMKDWENYRFVYLRELNRPDAKKWMKKRAEESKRTNVVLVCFEKDSSRCHRRLLAEEIARRFGAEYKGELTLAHIR